MSPVSSSGAVHPKTISQQLALMDVAATRRRLVLRSPLEGPVDLDEVIHNHVQGITRVDGADAATIICSVSGNNDGSLWFARFNFVADTARPGHRCLSDVGVTIASLKTATSHPGGMQASAGLLAVACESDTGWARVDIYDVNDPANPKQCDTLLLDNSQGGGVSQLEGSKAGWLAFTSLGHDE